MLLRRAQAMEGLLNDGPVRFPDLLGVPEAADLQKLSVIMCDPKRPATIVPAGATTAAGNSCSSSARTTPS